MSDMLLVVAALCLAWATRSSWSSASLRSDRNTLYDITFVDSSCGWAVGNRGVVLHTDDGGCTWRVQSSGTDYVLRAVFFLDRQTGWAVGGKSRIDRTGGKGVILHTSDGGRTWCTQALGLTAYLYDVAFVDSRRGWAVGEAKDNLDGAVVMTEDGGQTWVWEATGTRHSLSGVAISGGGAAAVGDDGGLFTRQETGRWRRSVRHSSSLHWRGITAVGPRVWAVGERAWIAFSPDGGKSWHEQTSGLSRHLADTFDLDSVCFVDEDHGWAVGGFGTLVLRTTDGGMTWRRQFTGSRTPLYGVHFADRRHGWAVGDMGAILHTGDGGETWSVQRSAGDGVRVMVAGAHHDDEYYHHGTVLTQLADLGVPIGCVVCVTDDQHEFGQTGEIYTQQFRDVANWMGIDVLREWRGFQDSWCNGYDWAMARWNAEWGDGPRELERKLVYLIRTWRPEIILTHDPIYGDYNKFGHKLTGYAATKAFGSAADPGAFREQIEEAGLDPWQANRLYYNMNHPIAGGVHPPSLAIDLGGYSAHLGCTHSYRLHRAVHYYWSKGHKEADVIPRWRGSWQGPVRRYHLARSVGPDLFGDIIPDREALAAARASSLTDQQAGEAADWEQFASALTEESETRRDQLVDQFIARRPAHPMAPILLLNRGREIESEEPEAALDLLDRFAAASADREEAYRAYLRTIDLLERIGRIEEADGRRISLAREYADLPEARGGWLQLARALMRRSEYEQAWQRYQTRPADWSPSPGEAARVHFEMGNAARLAGNEEAAQQLYASAAETADRTSLWATNARAEIDLHAGRLPSHAKLVVAERTQFPPTIDGRLIESIWESADAASGFLPLHSEWFEKPQPTEARFAYDDENLYVAALCRDQYHETLDPAIIRDHRQALWRRNYVAWVIDPERTYLRGREYWQKHWIVFAGTGPEEEREHPAAACRDRHGWSAEAAIPWSRLGRQPSGGDVWAVNIYREREAPTAVPAEGGFRWVEKTGWAVPYVQSRAEPWLVGYLAFR